MRRRSGRRSEGLTAKAAGAAAAVAASVSAERSKHLGRDDGDIAGARAALGPGRILGVSCYDDLAAGSVAAAAGADYLAFGSIFASATKPQAPRAALELLAAAKREFALPIAAIGGITLANAGQAITAGADLLAVITDLFDAMDIAGRARDYEKLFLGTP